MLSKYIHLATTYYCHRCLLEREYNIDKRGIEDAQIEQQAVKSQIIEWSNYTHENQRNVGACARLVIIHKLYKLR